MNIGKQAEETFCASDSVGCCCVIFDNFQKLIDASNTQKNASQAKLKILQKGLIASLVQVLPPSKQERGGGKCSAVNSAS